MCELIRDLRSEDGLDWFLDSNVILGGKANSMFGSDNNFSLIPEVVKEIRKRPNHKHANSYIDAIVESKGVVDRSLFDQNGWGKHFDFLNDCAKTLAPIIRAVLQDTDNKNTNNALQIAANEGTFFDTPHFFKAMVAFNLLTEQESKINKPIRRSWYRYPAKRSAKLNSGNYLWTDEKIVATAIGNSILFERPTVIISDDSDIAAIMKQTTDNILWSACVADSFASYGKPIQRKIRGWYEARCRDFETFRHSACLNRLRRISKAPDTVNPNLPEAGEVVVYRPNTLEFGIYSFSPEVRLFVTEINDILGGLDDLQVSTCLEID